MKTSIQAIDNGKPSSVTSLLMFEKYLVQNISGFKYLAQTFSSKQLSSFTDFRVSKAFEKFLEMTQVLTNRKVKMATKVKLI